MNLKWQNDWRACERGYSMLHKLIETAISAALLIPVFWMLNKVRFQNSKETIGYYTFAVYLSAVYLFVGMPTLQFIRFELSLTLIPFLPMLTDVKNTVLNVALFIPLGVLLPFLWKRYNTLKSTALFGLVLSLSIELLQIFTYRATDINDIIANTLGTVLGYFLFCMASRVLPSVTKFAGEKRDVPIIILSVFAVMFLIQPYLATLYYKIA